MNETGNDGRSVTAGLPDWHPPFEAPESEPTRDPNVYPLPGTVAVVLAHYQSDPESTYWGLRFHVRENSRTVLRRMYDRIGHCRLADIDTREIKGWYKSWTEGGTKISSGHSLTAKFRTIMTHGYLMMKGPERHECDRIRGLLRAMKFPMAKPREERLTADQATAIRDAARDHFYWPSMAMAQAFQFELMLRQKDAVGEMVPLKEPGDSYVTVRDQKWLRGIVWEEIDDNLILRHITSKRLKPIEADLRLCPMVMFEFAVYCDCPVEEVTRDKLPARGPIILNEQTAMPWKATEFRRKWRIVANHAGVPKTVYSMDSRAGGITEAFEAGADEDQIRQSAAHSNVHMTQRYNRRSPLKSRSDVQAARLEARNKNKKEEE